MYIRLIKKSSLGFFNSASNPALSTYSLNLLKEVQFSSTSKTFPTGTGNKVSPITCTTPLLASASGTVIVTWFTVGFYCTPKNPQNRRKKRKERLGTLLRFDIYDYCKFTRNQIMQSVIVHLISACAHLTLSA